MIRLAAEYFFLCAINSLHPTVFVNQYGHCAAMCDAYVYEITTEDYEVVKK